MARDADVTSPWTVYTFSREVPEVAVTVEVVVIETDEKKESTQTTVGTETSEAPTDEETEVETVVYRRATTDSTMLSMDGMDGKGGWKRFPRRREVEATAAAA